MAIEYETAYTFEACMYGQTEWTMSAGRWDTLEEAATKAGEWLFACAENGMCLGVRTTQVQELALIDSHAN